ncbi:hypothetical protein M0802_014350 [Mischocyttarus mexicanus]|nr:hypothetical protein M0802_014350 [Mischocyttarus mexicanus]
MGQTGSVVGTSPELVGGQYREKHRGQFVDKKKEQARKRERKYEKERKNQLNEGKQTRAKKTGKKSG